MSEPEKDPTKGPAREKPAAAIKRRSIARLLASDQRGAIIVFFALCLPILIGFMGLAVEVGYWYSQHRNLQSAADAAAVAGSYDLTNAVTYANREATNNGWNSTDGTITVRGFKTNATYPATGAYTTNDDAVEVVLSYDVDRMFSGYFLGGRQTLDVRAVGLSVAGASETCVLALGATNQQGALLVTGKFGGVIMDGCSMATNSTDSNAVKNQVGTMDADCIYSAGGIAGTVTTDCAGGPYADQPIVLDPYAPPTVPAPDDSLFSSCAGGPASATAGVINVSVDTNIGPGVYCSIKSTGGALTMTTGVYYLDGANGGNFSISGGATLDATTGVTIVLGTSDGSADCGNVTISGTSSIDIVATTDGGPYSGFAFYRSENCSTTESLNFTGTTDSTIEGVVYNPKGDVDFTGSGAVVGSCLQIIGDEVKFAGIADVGSDCDTMTGVKSILSGGIGSLVE